MGGTAAVGRGRGAVALTGWTRRCTATWLQLETMALEFGAVLTTQLESQRVFYEHQIESVRARRLQRARALPPY